MQGTKQQDPCDRLHDIRITHSMRLQPTAAGCTSGGVHPFESRRPNYSPSGLQPHSPGRPDQRGPAAPASTLPSAVQRTARAKQPAAPGGPAQGYIAASTHRSAQEWQNKPTESLQCPCTVGQQRSAIRSDRPWCDRGSRLPPPHHHCARRRTDTSRCALC